MSPRTDVARNGVATGGAASERIDALLVTVPFSSSARPGESNLVSIGPLLLGTILKKAGYGVAVLNGPNDPDYEQRLERILEEQRPLFVGFSVMTSQVPKAYELSQRIKRLRPELPIVWGGFHAIIFPEMVIADPSIDVVAQGEAVSVVVPLAEALDGRRPLDDVPGILFRRGTEVVRTEKAPLAAIADLPDLDWDLVDPAVLERFIVRRNPLGEDVRALPVLTGLGCHFRCTFCHNTIFQQTHRTLPAEAIVAQVGRLRARYGLTEVGFVDEHFFGDKPRFGRLLALLEKEPLGVQWSTNMRASDVGARYLDAATLRRLLLAGGYYFGMGAESGSPRILRKIKKGITVQQILDAATLSRTSGVTFAFSFMAGLPGETVDDVLMTLDLITQIRTINPKSLLIGPQLFRAYPGSELYDEAVANGLSVPTSLKGWSANSFASHSRRLDVSDLPWLPEPERFERVMLSFYVSDTRWSMDRAPARYRPLLRVLQRMAARRVARKAYDAVPELFLYRLVNGRMN